MKMQRYNTQQNIELSESIKQQISGLQTQQTKLHTEPFQQEFLEKNRTAAQFLKDCAYNVNLERLYKVVETCAYNKAMKYQPVLVEVLPDLGQYFDDKKYLLQVWDNTGDKAFELRLNHPVKQWGISFQYFIFKTMNDDENSDYFQIVDLENLRYSEQGMVRLNDFVQNEDFKFLAFQNEKFYIANERQIQVVDVPIKDLQPGEIRNQQVNPNTDVQVCSVDENIILGLALTKKDLIEDTVAVAIENQLDNVVLTCALKTKADNPSQTRSQYSFQLIDQAQYLPLRPINDPIIKYISIYRNEEEIHQAIALRQSGKIDIYFQEKLRERVDNITVKDVLMSFESIYIDHQDINKDIAVIDLKFQNRAIYKNHEIMKRKEFKRNYVLFDRIKNNYKVINSFILIETTLFVCHSHIVSLFQIQTQTFALKKHLSYESDIMAMFRKFNPHQKTNNIAVILQNGTIFTIKSQNPKDFDTWHRDKEHQLQLKGGEFLHIARDYNGYKMPLLCTKEKDGEQTYVSTIYDNELVDLSEHFPSLKKTDVFVGIYEEGQDRHFVLYQSDKVQVFILKLDENEKCVVIKDHFYPLRDEAKNLDFQQGFIDSQYLSLVSSRHMVKFRLNSDKLEKSKEDSFIIEDINWRGFMISHDHKYIFTLNNSNFARSQTSGFKFYVKKDITKYDDPLSYIDQSYHLEDTQVGCQGHIDYSVTSERYTFLADFHNIKIIPTIKNNTILLMGQEDFDIYLSTRQIKDRLYALTKNNVISTWDVLTGKKAMPDFNLMSGTPRNSDDLVNHYDSIQPFEDNANDNYQTKSLLNEQQTNNSIQTQKILPITNQAERSTKSKQTDYSKYEIFTCKECPDFQKDSLLDYTLIMCLKDEENYSDSDFFDVNQTTKQMKAHCPYILGVNKVYRRFKCIEVRNEKTVHEHLEFVWPYYLGETQKIYFNEDYSKMFEQKLGNICTIYRRENIHGSNECKWIYDHQFSDFPVRIGLKNHMDLLSPNYQYYLDMDFKIRGFHIKDAQTEEIVHTIPEYMMNFRGNITLPNGKIETKTASWLVHRFKWMTNTSFRVISDDGIETMIDFGSGEFKQVAYRNINNFDVMASKTQHAFYYRKPLDSDQTMERLKYNCRQYRSYLIFEKQVYPDFHPYESLFFIDYFQSVKNKRFVVDLSFSYLHWRLIEKMVAGEVQMDEIDDDIIQMICFNILPQGKTVMHELVGLTNTAEKLYKRAINQGEKDPSKKLKYTIPMFEDFNGKSSFDYSIEMNNFIDLNMHLKYLSMMPIDHHSRLIADNMPQMIAQELSNLPKYITSRQIQTQELKNYTDGYLPPNFKKSIQACYLLENPKNISHCFENSKNNKEIVIKYIDMPFYHCFQHKLCSQYFYALGHTNQLELMNVVPIQKQVDFAWNVLRRQIIIKNLVPYIVFFYVMEQYFYSYSPYMLEMHGEEAKSNGVLQYVIQILLFLYSLNLLYQEIQQLSKGVVTYFLNIWNWFDILIPILLLLDLLNAFINPITPSNDVEIYHIVESLILLLCTWKFMYFLRIFPSLGFYVAAILNVLYALRFYLFVLLLSLGSFGSSYLRLDVVNEESFLPFEGNIGATLFAYQQSRGKIDIIDGYGTVGLLYCRILWFIATIVNSIILFTLLIAIVQKVNGNINNVKDQQALKEKASMIADNLDLLNHQQRTAMSGTDEYLLFAEYEVA